MLASALALLLAAAPSPQATLPLRPCVVQGVPARCGALLVPENRDTGLGPRISLRVVVVPALRKPARPDAFTYLAGGPGGAASETAVVASIWQGVRERHDIVLVDQRGTGRSHQLECPEPEPIDDVGAMINACLSTLNGDPTHYGSAAAADDLEAVRAALGYRTLDVYGGSYGATLAQIYLARHPRSVRTVVLDGGTLLDIPFFERSRRTGSVRSIRLLPRCTAVKTCAQAFPAWTSQLRSLITAWNERPARGPRQTRRSLGDAFAGVIRVVDA